ncbi:18614_t:CDS:2, partial [Gigaspora margarita]
MANKSNKTVFDNIFAETHSKLESLNNKIFELQDIYLTNNDSDEKSDNDANKFIDNEMYNETSSKSLAMYIDNFFTAKQIEHFHKMYVLYPIFTVINNEKTHEKRLDKRDDKAFLMKLQQFISKNESITQNEVSLYFLEIIDASMHTTEFKNGMPKVYLTTNYKFKGVSICQKAWYTIYDIQKRRWKALCDHYQNFGLKPKIHGLTGC